MTNAEIHIEQFALATALRLCTTIRIACEWLELRMVCRLKQLANA